MNERLRRTLPVIIGFGFFLAALGVLGVELRSTSWRDADAQRARDSARGGWESRPR